MIKVLIVDDSAFFRTSISRILKQDPDIEVIGIAKDGSEAIEQIKKLKPDIVTMDIEMPKLDGLSTLEKVMKNMPLPVIMVSSLTTKGAEATLKALELGAVDFITKYTGSLANLDMSQLSFELCSKIKAVVAKNKRFPMVPFREDSHILPKKRKIVFTDIPKNRLKRDIVAIGVSTGGPPAVQKVLSEFPEDFPACILIAQHMPAGFTGPFAERLNRLCKVFVKEAENGDPIKNGCVYVCPGGKHIRIDLKAALPQLSVVEEPVDALYKPSVNVLMESVGLSLGSRAIGVIMTGMGSDGVEGIKVLKKKKGYIISQDEASSIVYGMPKAIIESGLADDVAGLDSIAESIILGLNK